MVKFRTHAFDLRPKPSLILPPRHSQPAAGRRTLPGPGGGSVVVDGRRRAIACALTDMEGGQACEIAFCDATGRFDTVGTRRHGRWPGRGAESSARQTTSQQCAALPPCKRRGIDLGQAKSFGFFGADSAGRRHCRVQGFARWHSDRCCTGRCHVAGKSGHGNRYRTSHHARSTVLPTASRRLPEPLADPLQDIRIRAATAAAYLVRAGEYIQVIDVSGRQCTDFQALSARKVDKGLDLALDSTVTRTLLGRSYPMPGLPSKAFDREFEPLVEIVQDTVGRHDAFATRLQLTLLRRHGLSRPRELHGEFQPRACSPMALRRARAGKRSTISTTPISTTITSSISTSRGRGPATMC